MHILWQYDKTVVHRTRDVTKSKCYTFKILQIVLSAFDLIK